MDFATVKRAVLKGFVWQGATKIFVQAASWAGTILVARLIAPSDYGVMAAAAVFTELMIVITEAGLGHGMVQKRETTRRQEDGVFWLGLMLGLAAYGLLFMAAPMIARFYAMPILTDILRVAALGVVIGAMKTVPQAIAMRRLDFRYRSLVEMGSSLAMTVTVVVLALKGFGVWALVWGPIARHLFMTLAYFPLMKRFPRPTLFSREVMHIALFGVQVTSTHLLYFGWSRADVFIIGKMLGEVLLGYYSMAFQLAVLPLDKVGSIFNQVLFPALSRLQSNLPESQSLFLELHRYLLIVSYPALFGLAVIADDFIELLLTDRWLPIVPYLQALCVVSAIRISGMLMPPALYARGRPNLVMRYSVLSAVVLPSAFLVGAHYGLQGIVIAWALAYPGLYLLLAGFCLRDLGLRWRDLLSSAMPALLATAVMVSGVMTFQATLADPLSLPVRTAASIGIGATLYIGCLSVLFRERLSSMRQRIMVLRSGDV